MGGVFFRMRPLFARLVQIEVHPARAGVRDLTQLLGLSHADEVSRPGTSPRPAVYSRSC